VGLPVTSYASILLIDHSLGECERFRQALRRSGLDVALYTECDAEAALRFLANRAGHEPLPSVILLDWHLEKTRGDTFMTRLRTHSCFASIPVVAFTTADVSSDLTTSYAHGANGYVVKPGETEALLTVKELSGRMFSGTITRGTLALDPATRTLLIEVDLLNRDHALQPGTFGEITLLLNKKPNALELPPSSILLNGKAKTVFLVDQGTAKRVQVKTGITDGRWIEIIEELTGGEQVVVVGKSNLRDGTPLTPSPYTLREGTPSMQRF